MPRLRLSRRRRDDLMRVIDAMGCVDHRFVLRIGIPEPQLLLLARLSLRRDDAEADPHSFRFPVRALGNIDVLGIQFFG